MNRPFSKMGCRLAVAVAALVLAGCASLSPPESPPRDLPPPPQQPQVEPPAPPDSTPPRSPDIIRPDQQSERVEQPAASPASGLLAQGWRLHSASDYSAAVNVAERAQRIEPRNPEVYLLMASAQLGLYQLDLAEQLARRGLSLSQAGSRVSGQLQGLLGRIAGAR